MSTTTAAAGLLQITESDDGSYTVKQLQEPSNLPKTVNDGDRININQSFGPVSIDAYVVPSTFEIGVTPYILGIKIGTFYGSLLQGVSVNVDLFVAKGGLGFRIDGKTVYVQIDLSGPFNIPNIHERFNIATLP